MEVTNLNIDSQILQKSSTKNSESSAEPQATDTVAPRSSSRTPVTLSNSEVLSAVEQISDFIAFASNNKLAITIDNDLEKIVMTVKNNESNEVIRQIPSEEALNLMKRMKELSEEYFGDAAGLLFEKKI